MCEYRLCYGFDLTEGHDTLEDAIKAADEKLQLGFTPNWVGKYNKEKDTYDIVGHFEVK